MKRSDTLTWSHVRTGIFIVIALLCAAGGVVVMGDKTKYFVPKEGLSVIISDVAGLKAGAYTVLINNMRATFTLAVDNVAP